MRTKTWIGATAGFPMLTAFLAAAAFSFLPLPADADCSCSGMALKTSGTTGTVCSNSNLNLPECTKSSGSSKGCSTTYAYSCPLGVNDAHYSDTEPYQRTGFQPVATLANGSTASQCKTGQVLQETILSNGSVALNPTINPTSLSGVQTLGTQTVYIDNSASNEFPQVGATSGNNPKFGGDDYRQADANNVLMSVTSSAITWWDNTDQTKDSQAEAAKWTYKFISYVIGSGTSATSCQCSFTIQVNWPSNNNPTTTYSTPSCSTW